MISLRRSVETRIKQDGTGESNEKNEMVGFAHNGYAVDRLR